MKYNIKLAIIVSLITAIVTGMFLGTFGESLGIPKSWNTALVGAFTGTIASIVGQKFAKPDEG